METWTVKKILDWGIEFFRKKGIPGPRLSAELLLASVLGLTRMELYLDHGRVLSREELARYKGYILKRLEHVPIQYILGQAYFRNISLKVGRAVLIPRPETELLVEKALEESARLMETSNRLDMLEVGTGSGAIAISLCQELNLEYAQNVPDISITATDTSSEAVGLARENADRILEGKAADVISFFICDVFPGDDRAWMETHRGNIDLVVSNPPYIREDDYLDLPREIREYEPRDALVSGYSGLEAYEKILTRIKDIINTDRCTILLETDPLTSDGLMDVVSNQLGKVEMNIIKDYNDKNRILSIYI